MIDKKMIQKTRYGALAAAMMFMSLTGCSQTITGSQSTSSQTAAQKATTAQYAKESSAAQTTAAAATVSDSSSSASTSAAVQSDTITQTANNASSANAGAVDVPANAGAAAVSAKGYAIENRDGVTYVNNILIANKTYALPSSYSPGSLDEDVMNAFYAMQADAASQGLNLYISSGFRSYNTQRTIYNNYVNKDGQALADTYSARAGHSEHQTGLAFDLNTIEDSFAFTDEGKWVAIHAQEYGFIIRYPKGKENITGYQYEPWHLRYLGNELAQSVYNSGLCLEEYLGIDSRYQ